MWRTSTTPLLLAAALAVAGLGCPSLGPPDLQPDAGTDTSRNHAPVLAPVGTQTYDELVDIRIVLTAYDADGDSLMFGAGLLPEGADFDPVAGVFSWRPPLGASNGSPYQLEFSASDGEQISRAYGTLMIEPAPLGIREVFPARIPQTGGTLLTVTGVGFEGNATLRIAGVAAQNLEMIDGQSLRATAPALPNDFGPQVVSLSFDNGRSTQISGGVFVYRDQQDLRLGTHRVALPAGAELLGAADIDGIGGAELLVGTPDGLLALDPTGEAEPRTLFDEPVRAVERADLDGDREDEVLITARSGDVYVWRALDAPPLQVLHEGSPAAAVTALDLEGDGDLEVVVVDKDGARWLYPWIDAGGFGAVIPSATDGAIPVRVFPVDLDGDGVNDLVLDLGDGFGFSRGVETGAFLPAEIPTLGAGLEGAAPEWRSEELGWEVAAIDREDEMVHTFRRLEGGIWRPDQDRAFAPRDGDLFLDDAVGDGALELLTTGTGRPSLRVDALAGDVLDDTAWLMLGPVAGPPLLADLDGDRIEDLGAASADGTAVVWAERRRTGELPSAPLGLFSDQGLGLRVADYTRDGYVDIVVTGSSVDDFPVHLLFQLDSPGLRGAVSIALPATGNLEEVVLGDVTGDRWTDILSLDERGRVTCTPAFSPSTFGPPVASQFARPAVQLVPVDRGSGSIFVGVRFDDGGVLVAQSDDRCNLTLVDRLETNAARIDAGDLDGDRRAEVFSQTADGAIEIFRSRSGTSYTREARLELGLDGPDSLAEGDVDGDGRGDLVLAGDEGVELLSDVLTVGSGELARTILDSTVADGVAVGDLNGDGFDEVVATGGGVPPRIYWVAGDTMNVQTLPAWHAAGRAPFLSDVDRDADLDIVTLEPHFGAVIWGNGAAP